MMFHEISENMNIENFLEACFQFTHPTDFCIICSHLYQRKIKIYIFFILKTKIKRFVHRKSRQMVDKSLKLYFLFVKEWKISKGE